MAEVVGIIAQDLNEVIPHAVNITPDGEHFVNYNQVTPVLIGAVKELKTENETLKAENTVLINELNSIKSEIQAIKDTLNK